MKHSKPQLREQDERLCFYCNQLGHLKRNCPEIPYCSKCRTRGHTQDRCTSKPQQNGHTHQTEESRDQQRRNQDLPQFLSHHNRCLHCAGDHQTANCTTTQQRQTPTTNSPASGTGTSIHQNAPRQLDCFTIALGKKTGTTFPITFYNKQNYNALYDTGAGASLINYSAYVSLGQNLDTGYQTFVKNASGEDTGALGQVTCTFTINNKPFTQSFIVCRHMQ